MWSSSEPSSVVRSIRTLDGQDASELRYVAAVTIWVDWTCQPARGGGDQPPDGAQGPQPPDQTAAIRLLHRNGQSQSAADLSLNVDSILSQ